MSILQSSSPALRQRLLDLFPVASLRSHFSIRGSKEDITRGIAASGSRAHVERIEEFIDQNMRFCKQHVHVLSHSGDVELPDSLASGERIASAEGHGLYLVRTRYKVIQLDPLEHDHIDFLWPIRIDLLDEYALVRFVVLEKNISSYFDRQVIVRGRSIEEEGIIAGICVDGTLGRANLNRGIKAIWAKDMVDAIRVKYMTPESTNTQNMHEAKGLKRNDPKAYKELQRFPLYMSVFQALDGLTGLQHFSTDPTNGMIGFTKYSKEGGSGDELIQQILDHN